MKDKTILTAESVTAGHPDKLCDTIADTVLDCCLEHDPNARVACEVLATAGKFVVAGEISALTIPDISSIVRDTVRRAGYNCRDFDVEVLIHPQSPDIADAVADSGQAGAGDQGIMYGYACSETENLLPLPVVLAHRLTALLTCARTMGRISGLRPDGKAQVSVEYVFGAPRRISAIVLSCQHAEDKDLSQLREELLEFVIQPALRIFPADEDTEIFINPSGRFVLGGIEADTGLTGRKLMVDTYGGLAPHGGGALSGKDGTKVDRSGAYMARCIAKNIVAAGLAEKCTVALAYAIGRADCGAVCAVGSRRWWRLKYIASCSFGKDSIATILLALRYGEPLDEAVYCEVMFDSHISGEVPEHRDFIYGTAIPALERMGVKIRILRGLQTYVGLFTGRITRGPKKGLLRSFPICGRCAVQRDCKLKPILRYQRSLPPDTVQYIGIARDEQERLLRLDGRRVSLLDKYGYTEQDAKQLCREAGLLSPVYDFTDRGGCWFCPNARRRELRHLYDHHPDLWARMLELQALPGKVTEKFNRTTTFSEIDAGFRREDEQLSLWKNAA